LHLHVRTSNGLQRSVEGLRLTATRQKADVMAWAPITDGARGLSHEHKHAR
jgi:hypothetical protein